MQHISRISASESLSVPVVPIGKPRMNRKSLWTPAARRYFDYCKELRRLLPGYQLPDRLFLMFFIPMPPSWSKKRRASSLGKPHGQTPDIDNLCKGFMDAFMSEDKRVYAIRAEKYWSEVGEITILPYDDVHMSL